MTDIDERSVQTTGGAPAGDGSSTQASRLKAAEVASSRKRRRPSGELPPLPRKLHTAKYWLGFAGLMVLAWLAVSLVSPVGERGTRFDLGVLRWFDSIRTDWLTTLARGVEAIGSDLVLRVARWATLLILLVFKRFRHLLVFFGSILVVGAVTSLTSGAIARPRPLGIEILTFWQGPSHPSRPMAALAVVLIGISYSLVLPGRPRTIAKWVTAVALFLFALARLYLGAEHLSDTIVGAVIGITIPLVAFRLLTPNEVFPVTYKRGRAAHLDVGGERGIAIRQAVEQQLGIRVIDMKPFGLGGSGGSTPLRLSVEGAPGAKLFAKLYARNHLRADRWYKLGRTLLYGRLEDEGSFSTVRRLIQYEDYLLRYMRDAELKVPRPYGFVEITPEREYLLVTGFIDNAEELLEADIDDTVIDDGLRTVRALWDAGVAHRDIKPSNVLVSDHKVHLIDVAFGEVRPSPWRQAVDLANMMLVLAFRTSPERVYERALDYFTPEDIAEAFAATHSVTMPSQSRSVLRKARLDLVDRFRKLAPKRRPIAIQRWSWRRIVLTLGVVLGALLLIQLTFVNLRGAGLFTPPAALVLQTPECREPSDQLVLMAQSVPSASMVPCLESLPVGWSFSGLDAREGSSRFHLNSDRAGVKAASVSLTPRCDVSEATEIPSDEPGTRRFEHIRAVGQDFAGTRYYVFDGGCVAYRFNFLGEGRTSLANEVSLGLGFFPREALAEELRNRVGVTV